MTAPGEIVLETSQGKLAGLTWRRDGAPRVLALHGWLDNAASFLPLGRLLDRVDLVALDLPGHGHSAHRHDTARYHFIDYLMNLDAALDGLDWPDCHLLGHSLGASIAIVYAAGAPERVRSAVLLDGLGPLTGAEDATADRLRRSLRKNRLGPGKPRRYESLDAMAAARRQASPDLSAAAARLICERSARRDGDAWVWRSDPALNWVSSLIMTEGQALDLLRHVECPVLTIQALPVASWFSEHKIGPRKAALRHATHLAREGHHHFHMDEPESIADTIGDFFLEHDHAPPVVAGAAGADAP